MSLDLLGAFSLPPSMAAALSAVPPKVETAEASVPISPAAPPVPVPVASPGPPARLESDQARRDRIVRTYSTMTLGGLLGLVAGGAAGAALWPGHRFAGAMLGSLLVGAPAGAAAASVVALNQQKDSR